MTSAKLYYTSSYIKNFDACVLSCEKCDGGYLVVLDKTAFFPEAGGQTSDKGYISDSRVLHVDVKGDEILHLCDKPLSVGVQYSCTLDFEERFDKMQQHTAEHILSGIFHSLYGIENTGFHLGCDVVTFDTSVPVTGEMLLKVEREANFVVQKNLPVTAKIYPDGATDLQYRSKMEIAESLRLVTVEGVDVCACCAPHVAYTGEIGLIKLIYSEKHKGGSRIYMLAGKRAYEYTVMLQSNAKIISNSLCAKVEDIGVEVVNLTERLAAKERQLLLKNKRIAELYAMQVTPTEGNFVIDLGDVDISSAKEFANMAMEKVKGFLVCLVGYDKDYKYIICHHSEDILKNELPKINKTLLGRGGGRGSMVQGSFSASYTEIEEYFK